MEEERAGSVALRRLSSLCLDTKAICAADWARGSPSALLFALLISDASADQFGRTKSEWSTGVRA